MARLSRILQAAMPLALFAWLIDFVARDWGIIGVLFLCMGAGAVAGMVLAIRAKLGVFQIYKATRYGTLPGVLAWVVIAPVLGFLGYEAETGPRKARDAALAAVDAAMVDTARRGGVPWDHLDAEVAGALGRLPNHHNDRPPVIAGLVARLKHPDPLVQSQAMLALGRYEGYADRLMAPIEQGLRSGEPRMRAAAVNALAGMRPLTQPMQSQMLAMLADPDRDVRLATAEAVRRVVPVMKGEGSKERLRGAVEKADPEVRGMLEDAIGRDEAGGETAAGAAPRPASDVAACMLYTRAGPG